MLDNDIFIIVDELPVTGETDKIYLLATDNKLIEYLWVNNAWDPVGMVEFDIDNYYTKNEVTALISASLQSAKDYADGLAVNYDAAGSAASALQSAKDYADGLAVNYDAAGSATNAANTAETNAKNYTDSAIQSSITTVLGGSY